MNGMAFDAPSPLGISWGYLALLLLPLLLATTLATVLIRHRFARRRLWLLLLAAGAAGVWTFLTIGASVVVPIPQDPQGAECAMKVGDNPGGVVPWESDCGKALARHLVISTGPTLVMFGVTIGALAHGLRRRDGTVTA